MIAGVNRTEVFFSKWRRSLAVETRRTARCSWSKLTRRELAEALMRSIRRLHRPRRAARDVDDRRALHEWRKVVIVMREQLNGLRSLLANQQRGVAGQLQCVARNLGATGLASAMHGRIRVSRCRFSRSQPNSQCSLPFSGPLFPYISDRQEIKMHKAAICYLMLIIYNLWFIKMNFKYKNRILRS